MRIAFLCVAVLPMRIAHPMRIVRPSHAKSIDLPMRITARPMRSSSFPCEMRSSSIQAMRSSYATIGSSNRSLSFPCDLQIALPYARTMHAHASQILCVIGPPMHDRGLPMLDFSRRWSKSPRVRRRVVSGSCVVRDQRHLIEGRHDVRFARYLADEYLAIYQGDLHSHASRSIVGSVMPWRVKCPLAISTASSGSRQTMISGSPDSADNAAL